MRKILYLAILAFVMTFKGGLMASSVGYVNILNGQIPSEAFIIERQGTVVVPEEAYTTLEDGDTVRPAPGAALLFTPDNTSCAPVDIQDVFVASTCPRPDSGLMDLAYDFVSSEFMAAPLEEVGMFATRGASDNVVFTLPPQSLRVYVEPAGLAGSLGKNPFIAVFDQKAGAELLITGTDSSVTLANADGGAALNMALPADDAKLRRAVLGRLNLKAMRGLTAPGQWPEGLTWSVEVLAGGPGGEVDFDGRKWTSARTLTVTGPGSAEPVEVPGESLLRFSIDNQGSKPYYAYLVNFTDEGQVLPVLPPDTSGQVPNLVHAGKTLALPQISLELGAPVEYVRLIVSERPLDLSQFTQDSLDDPSVAKPVRLRPVPKDAWQTALAVFRLN